MRLAAREMVAVVLWLFVGTPLMASRHGERFDAWCRRLGKIGL